jgi:NDP-4-keto-2,6-dideoxyhexose 3-C-methyltransferase
MPEAAPAIPERDAEEPDMYTDVTKCRVCGNSELVPIVSLGQQSLTGVFPKRRDQQITAGPLELLKCSGDASRACGLLQLKQSYDLNEMYGLNYGYRSGLNRSMVEHLHEKVRKICAVADPRPGELIIDIGSNDSTLLQAYPKNGYTLAGIDPSGTKFAHYYPSHIKLVPDFFRASVVERQLGGQKAKVISSIAMFYDLESPIDFMREVKQVLADDGIWLFEQSYMPTMLEMNAYDTICHEHLEYYGLAQIKWMVDRVGFKIIDVELNAVNGGSFSVIVAKSDSAYPEATATVQSLLQAERDQGLDTLAPFHQFKTRIFEHRDRLKDFLRRTKADGSAVLGYGASTKGNVILQFCDLTTADIPAIAEVNEDKFGCFTPGTLIPIISESDARARQPDAFLVLPWHFRATIIEREQAFLSAGGKLLFPLPRIEAFATS